MRSQKYEIGWWKKDNRKFNKESLKLRDLVRKAGAKT